MAFPALLLLLASPFPHDPPQPTSLLAEHRSGQTFLTWTERDDLVGESYRVYRHDQPLDATNLAAATLLMEVPEGSARFFADRYRMAGTTAWQARYLERYVIEDDGSELPAGTGLLVWTLAPGEAVPGGAHYAVTTVEGGHENLVEVDAENAVGPVDETPAEPSPVRTTVDVGPGGTLYLQFLDVRAWNPTFHAPRPGNDWYGLDPTSPGVSGALQYAYEYVVYAPEATACAGGIEPRSPVMLFLHGWNDDTYPPHVADPFPEYCGYKVLPTDTCETWWFGFAAEHDYRTGDPVPAGDRIENYTERRVLRMLRDLLADPVLGPALDPERIYVFGHSMGGSGALAMALRYPEVFAAAHANDPMTDFATAGDGGGRDWRPELAERWGDVALGLPVALDAPAGWADALAPHEGTDVWAWQDHQANVLARRGEEIVPIGITHGSLDTVVEWSTQGAPAYAPWDASDRAWGGKVLATGHSWKDFAGLPPSLAKDANGVPFAGLRVVRDETVPGLARATTNSPLPPGGTASYNHLLEWASSWDPWDAAPVDQAQRWELSLRSITAASFEVDVTPRRTRAFSAAPGVLHRWENHDVASGATLAFGTLMPDADGLVTVPAFHVSPGGNRLVLVPDATPAEIRAAFAASPASGAAPLSVAFSDLSSGPVASWSWDFGDGGTSTEREPVHVYQDTGVYDVSLTVLGSEASDTLTRPGLVTVSPGGTITIFGCGVNPPGSLLHLAGAPNLGQTFTFGIDNPLGTQGTGSRVALHLSLAPDPNHPCGSLLPNWGMSAPGAAGEVLIARGGGDPFVTFRGPLWAGPGNPSPITIRTPTSAAFIGLRVYAQGVITDPNATFGVVRGLTDAAEIVVGP